MIYVIFEFFSFKSYRFFFVVYVLVNLIKNVCENLNIFLFLKCRFCYKYLDSK